MNRRLREIIRAVLAIGIIALLLGGVPIALYRFAGTPGGDISRALTDGLSSDNTRTEQLLRGSLVLIGWLCWAQLAVAFVAETRAAMRGSAARAAAVLPGIQALAARLIAASTLLVTSVAPAATAAAGPLTPVSALVEPAPTPTLAPLGNSDAARHMDVAFVAPTSAIVAADVPVYLVQERDTLWDLAERFLGDGLRWGQLRDENLGRTMADGAVINDATETLQPGWDLHLPAGAVLPLNVTPHAAGTTPLSEPVQVERGEHFWQLATDALTSAWGRPPSDPELAPFWADMIELNQANLAVAGQPDLVYAGQTFLVPPIPTDPHAETAATRADPQSTPTAPATEPAEAAEAATPTPTPTGETAPADTSSAPSIITPAADETHAPAAATEGHGKHAAGYIALGLGGLATGAGALAITLRRLRHHQAARRQPGTTPLALPPLAIDYEARTRTIADTEASRWIDATNRYLTRQLAANVTGASLPSLIAVRAGTHGIELLLDEPCPPADGFVKDPTSQSAWRLDPSLELAELEAAADGHQPYSPALLPVGRTDGGELHLDLEQIGILSIDGEPNAIESWYRTIAAGVATVSTANYCTVVALDPAFTEGGLEQLTVPADPNAWAEQFVKEMNQLHQRLDSTPYQQRVTPGEIFHPTIVLIGPTRAALAGPLADAAALINTPMAVIATTPLPFGSRLFLTTDQATFEPTGLDFTPALTSAAETEAVATLLHSAAEDAEAAPAVERPAVLPVADALHAACPQEPVAELIARVTAKCPIEVQLLTPRPRIRGLGKQPTSKVAAVIGYLAYHRTISSQTVREHFWPASTSRSTADNAMSQVRQLLGTSAEGTHRLTIAINSGRYELSDEVGCDWTKATALIELARTRCGQDAMDLLRAGLEQADGRFAADADRNFGWLHDDYQVYSVIERTLIDAADRLGELALDASDHALARWAADKGLAIVPGQEPLRRIEMRAAAGLGDLEALRRAYTAAAQFAETLGPWCEVQPETHELFTRLCSKAQSPKA